MAATMRKRVRTGRHRAIEEPEIIVIPMIDVMMFLLFFFMVLFTYPETKGVTLEEMQHRLGIEY